MPAFDIEQPGVLVTWLHDQGKIDPGEAPRVTVLAGGVSNRTVLVERSSGEAWVVKQALEKLRVQVDWFSSPERIHREALGIRWLTELAPPGTITPFVFEDQLRSSPGHAGRAATPSGTGNRCCSGAISTLVTPISSQFSSARFTGNPRAGAMNSSRYSATAASSKTSRLEPYYEYAASQVPESSAFYAALLSETRAISQTIVHGDYSPKNVLVYDGRLILLDHEVIHFGDPGFDLGFALTHLISKAHHLPEYRSGFANAANDFWNRYEQTVSGCEWADDRSRAPSATPRLFAGASLWTLDPEYLDGVERTRQRRIVLELMQAPPVSVSGLVTGFIDRL
ncbi:MAG: aminoglycoside phosphotransferase family protein [Thermomicrobiales bacterium]